MPAKYLNIKKTDKIFDIRKKFNKVYPNLSLIFTKKSSQAPSAKDVLDVYQEIGKAVKNMKEGKVDISPEKSVFEIVESFSKDLNLFVTIGHFKVCYDLDPRGELEHLFCVWSRSFKISDANKVKPGKKDYYHWF